MKTNAPKKHSLLTLISLCFFAVVGYLPSVGYGEETETSPDDWYQFEVIIFEHLRSDRHELRYEGVKYPGKTDQAKASIPQSRTPLVEAFTAKSGAVPVTLEDAALKDAYLALNRSSRSRVYSFTAWKQKLNRDEEVPQAIHFDRPNKDNWTVEGTLQLRRERYIHADFELSFYRKSAYPSLSITEWLNLPNDTEMDTKAFLSAEPIEFPLSPLPFYFEQLAPESQVIFEVEHQAIAYDWLPLELSLLNESQRLRDGEIHYLDHPAFGIVITMEKTASPDEFSLDEPNS